MKYNWESMTDEQKATAIKRELELDTHNGTTKDDLLNMLRWLCEEESEKKHRNNKHDSDDWRESFR